MNLENLDVFDLGHFPASKIFVDLNKNFRKILFYKALQNSNNNMLELAKRLNYDWRTLYGIKKGSKKKGRPNNIRLDLFNKLIFITKIDSFEAINSIESLRYGRNSKDIPNIFPLKYDNRLATLIGHATGDGHIKEVTYNFEYRNSSKELIEKVYRLIFDIFNIKCKIYSAKDGTRQIEVPSIVGYIMHKAGAHVGNKIKGKFEIPKWIMQGDKDIVSSYLGALVDDEFSISKGKVISFSLSKNIELKENLLDFFESIRNLFLRLDIKSNKTEPNKVFLRKDGIKTISIQLNICGQKNFRKFKNNIPITNKAKINSLNQLVNSYVLEPYEKYGYNKIKGIVLNKLKLGYFTTTQLTKKTTISRRSFLKHLTRMKKDGLIKEINRLMYGEILWSLNYDANH